MTTHPPAAIDIDNHQCVSLHDLTVEMAVGVADWERHPDKTQRVIVDIDLYAPLSGFTGTQLADCLDYDRLYRHVTTHWPGRPHTDLLETLAEELVGVCLEDRRVTACRVRLRKPDVYNGRAVPAVTFVRSNTAPLAGRV